jgi:hypothetical protein
MLPKKFKLENKKNLDFNKLGHLKTEGLGAFFHDGKLGFFKSA